MEQSALMNPLQDNHKKNQESYKIWRVVGNVLAVCLGPFYFGYTLAYFPVIPIDQIINEFKVTMSQDVFLGLFAGLIPVGAGIASAISSILVTKMSRRQALLFICYFSLIGGALVQITTFETLFIGRLIQGLCVGFYSSVCPLIIKQLSPIEISGTLGALNQFSIIFGIICTNIISIFIKDTTNQINHAWRYIFLVPVFLVIIQAVLLHFVYPNQTIKYLLLNDRLPQARQLASQCYNQQYVDDILRQKQEDIRTEEIKIENKKPSTKSTLMALHLGFLQQMSGINVVILYGSKIMEKAIPGKGNILQTVLNLLQFFGCFLSIFWLLKKFGRKPLIQTGLIIEAISILIIATAFLPHFNDYQHGKNIIITVFLIFFTFTFGYSLGPVIWLYVPEIVQPNIVSYATLCNWIGASLCIILFPIIGNHIGQSSIFFFLGIWMIVSFIVNQIYMIQTKDKTEKEINEQEQQRLPNENNF